MITQVELEEVQENLKVKPVNHSILVLVPKVSETTEGGIIKSESLMEEEQGKLETFLTVVAVSEDLEGFVKPGDRVYVQGNIMTFDEKIAPPELKEVQPEGYTFGHTMAMYIKMVI